MPFAAFNEVLYIKKWILVANEGLVKKLFLMKIEILRGKHLNHNHKLQVKVCSAVLASCHADLVEKKPSLAVFQIGMSFPKS